MGIRVLGQEIATDLAEKLQPDKTALLVVDVQNDFVDPSGAFGARIGDTTSLQKILEPLRDLTVHARQLGIQVINIQMTLDAQGRSNSPVDLARRTKIWRESPLATIAGTWGHENPPMLGLKPEDLKIPKYRNNAFVGTSLDLHLRSRSIRTLIVTGVSTHACVLETALMAQSMDYYVVVPVDCVASASNELHEAALAVMGAVLHHEGLTTSLQIRQTFNKWSSSHLNDAYRRA